MCNEMLKTHDLWWKRKVIWDSELRGGIGVKRVKGYERGVWTRVGQRMGWLEVGYSLSVLCAILNIVCMRSALLCAQSPRCQKMPNSVREGMLTWNLLKVRSIAGGQTTIILDASMFSAARSHQSTLILMPSQSWSTCKSHLTLLLSCNSVLYGPPVPHFSYLSTSDVANLLAKLDRQDHDVDRWRIRIWFRSHPISVEQPRKLNRELVFVWFDGSLGISVASISFTAQ